MQLQGQSVTFAVWGRNPKSLQETLNERCERRTLAKYNKYDLKPYLREGLSICGRGVLCATNDMNKAYKKHTIKSNNANQLLSQTNSLGVNITRRKRIETHIAVPRSKAWAKMKDKFLVFLRCRDISDYSTVTMLNPKLNLAQT